MTATGGPARLVRVYWLWILLVTAVVMAAGYEVSMLSPTMYRSAAIVVIEARVRANTTPVQPEMGTEKELARSSLVVRPAAEELGVDAATLTDGLTVTVAPDANVLTFTYDAADPVTARRRAQALAEAYVDYRNSGEVPSTAPAAGAKAATNANSHATLVTPAYLPDKPQSPPVWVDLGIGLVLGLLLGTGTALVRDRMSDRVRGLGDLERITGLTVLATVPRTRRPRGSGASRSVLLRAPESPAAESYRYLRSRLQPLLARQGATSVLVASAHEGEGRSATAAGLAVALALAGRSVVAVDADLHRPHLHRLLDLDDDRGLVGVLAGEIDLDAALQPGPVPGLWLLAAGPAGDPAGDLLDGQRLGRLLRALRRQFDVIVLDSAAVLGVADAIALASVSDHVLLVADYRRSTRAGVTRALAELGEAVHGNVSGVLVNVPRSSGGLVPRRFGGGLLPWRFGGGLVPRRSSGAGPAPAMPDHGPRSPRGPLPDRSTSPRPAPAFGSAAVSAAPTAAPASTVYTSSSATAPSARTPVRAGPVKARINGAPVPAPRTGGE